MSSKVGLGVAMISEKITKRSKPCNDAQTAEYLQRITCFDLLNQSFEEGIITLLRKFLELNHGSAYVLTS